MRFILAALALAALPACRPASSTAAGRGGPVEATFVDLPRKIEAARCERVLAAIIQGGDADLGVGDVVMLTNGAKPELGGRGGAVVARVHIDRCDEAEQVVSPGRGVAPVTFAGGAMTARLDVLTPDIYIGRLEGTAPVAEHEHASSWEILAAVDASGTFVRDGVESPLRGREIVQVAPGTKHAWRPAPGSKLVAVQLYYPPGPEQRFLKLADAGAP